MVASIIAYSLSGSSAKALKRLAHTPFSAQREKRRWVFFQSPKRSGKSRHHDEPGRTYGGIGKTGFTKPRESIAPFLEKQALGRWPANVIHDGSAEVLAHFPESDGQQGNVRGDEPSEPFGANTYGQMKGRVPATSRLDSGNAARFFYRAKADDADRLGSKHPTVKPIDLMGYLAKLVTPPGGTVLDPFAGSGATGMACMREGFQCILIEREAEYVADIKRRIAHVRGDDAPLFAATAEPA